MISNLLLLSLTLQYIGLVSSDLIYLSQRLNTQGPHQFPLKDDYPHQFPLKDDYPHPPHENTDDFAPWSPLFSALSITNEDIENFHKFIAQIGRVKNMNFGVKERGGGGHGNKKRFLQSGDDEKELNCGPGRISMASRLMDKCVGQNCSISILQCGNQTYQYNSVFSGDLRNCTVKQLVCLNATNHNDTTLVDLQGQCYLHRVKLNDLELNITLVLENLKLFQCQVEVLCGTTVYGWDAFGYNCKSDELFCDGKIVDYPNGKEVDSRCEIRSKGCSTFGHNSNDTCHEITTVCTNSPSEQVCNQQIEDHRIQCFLNQTNRCVPETISCGGTVYNVSTYTGLTTLCTIQSVRCDTVGKVEFPSLALCTIVDLACNGTIETFTNPNQAEIPSHCSISKVICISYTNGLCTTHQLGCLGDTSCRYVDRVLPCRNECFQLGPVPTCACPVDFGGDSCQDLRTLACNMTMVTPMVNCVPGRLFAPSVCLQFNKKDTLSLIYSLSCAFKDYTYNLNQAQNDGFNYSFISDQLALSESPENYYISMKIFNFDVFSDNNQTIDITLNGDYFLERKFLKFEVDLNKVDPGKYMAGNMMYLEYRLKSNHVFRPTLHHGVVGREYIEITGLPPIKMGTSINYYWIIFGLVTGILCVTVIVYVVYRRIRKNKKLKKKQT